MHKMSRFLVGPVLLFPSFLQHLSLSLSLSVSLSSCLFQTYLWVFSLSHTLLLSFYHDIFLSHSHRLFMTQKSFFLYFSLPISFTPLYFWLSFMTYFSTSLFFLSHRLFMTHKYIFLFLSLSTVFLRRRRNRFLSLAPSSAAAAAQK